MWSWVRAPRWVIPLYDAARQPSCLLLADRFFVASDKWQSRGACLLAKSLSEDLLGHFQSDHFPSHTLHVRPWFACSWAGLCLEHKHTHYRPCGPVDQMLAFVSRNCMLESCHGHQRFYVLMEPLRNRTCGLVAMTSASHAEGRQFDPGQVYLRLFLPGHTCHIHLARIELATFSVLG